MSEVLAQLDERAKKARAPICVAAVGMGWLPEQPGNGLDRVYFALAQHLPAEGVEVAGLVVGSENVAASTGGRIVSFAADNDNLLARVRGLREAFDHLAAERRPDLIASHFALFAYPLVGRTRDLPHVVHFHGPWHAEARVEGSSAINVAIKRHVEKRVYASGDRFIVLSTAFRDVLVETFGVPADRIRIVPGGVEVDRFDTGFSIAEARSRMNWPADRPTVLTVRRLARRMGLERLVESFRTVLQRLPDAQLLIAGTGPIETELRQLIEERGLGQSVRLLGFVAEEDLPYAYAASDVTIIPTVALEGFGLATVESLASGTPVLVSPNGGLPGVVSGLSEDLVLPDVEPGTIAEALTGALLGTLSLPDRNACRAYARDHYDWSAAARRTRRVYEEVLS